ncbi:unnamed protein product [Soboliphyme baturini]|uniref:Reverse transcriptase domain-containing protein n=1 Tax=Soboliphyme baturini TaxID=241478 RepID=A0A183IST9_9BILA|nr:unnamed protein product [Soboliphyme baturini]
MEKLPELTIPPEMLKALGGQGICWPTRKVYTKVLGIADLKIQEEQCGFLPRRSTSDHIFALRQIVEKSWEYAHPVHMCSVDLEKAYDRIPRNNLRTCLRAYGIDGQLLRGIQSLYFDRRCCVRVNGVKSKPFNVRTGLRQGLRPVPYPVCVVHGQNSEELPKR